ncbi:MAG: WxcM-like domain-containing protein [Gammaproteobacteria bacterium]|jgi:dTDP-4-dehydrorhamnose 3,5-epimerase
MENKSKIIKGGVDVDDRGSVAFVNDFCFDKVKRFYQVENHSLNFIRAWHGHRKEGKYFYVAKGAAMIGAANLETDEVERFILTSRTPSILWIPPNYANGSMNLEEGTIIQVFSTATLEESLNDDIRIRWDKWNIWDIEYR